MELNTTRVTPSETLEQYLWRLGNNREALGLTWADVADLCNRYFVGDETEYLGESAYRKKYQAAKKFYDEVFVKEDFKSDDIEEQRRELLKLKQQLRDERTSLYSRVRSEARLDQNFQYLSDQLQEIGRVAFSEYHDIQMDGDKDIICILSDLHLGQCFDSMLGTYDSLIAKNRLDEYLGKVIEIGKKHNAESCYVAALGDLINGAIRLTVQLSNRENLTEQIKRAAELISSFCFELSKYFKNVYIANVSGNHSRLVQNKEDALKDERADDLIMWICQKMLTYVNNIQIVPNIDTTLSEIEVRGKKYALCHGDLDSPSDSAIGKLMLMLGHVPYAILSGHRHSMFYKEFNGIRYIQAGSLCGSGDDYTVQKRLAGKPNQTVLVCDDNGIECIYNVELT